MDNLYKTLFYEWQQKKVESSKPREYDLTVYSKTKINKIIVLTGFRRVGKTTLLFDLAIKLQKKNPKNVLYINFEDERIPIETSFLTGLSEAILEFYPNPPQFILLDEIQLIPNWSKWLRRMYDNTDFRFYVTGSNSKMSSAEIPTELRGRFIELYISPLNFKEFLNFKDFNKELTDIEYRKSDFIKLKKLLDEFIFDGGLPEIVLENNNLSKDIAQSYFATVVSRDIIERNLIKNTFALKTIIKQLVQSQTFTISKMYNSIKSMQIDIGKNTISEYIGFIEGSYFFRFLTCFSFKVRKSMMLPRKVYCIDRIFLSALSTKFSKNTGWYYENTVASSLFNTDKEVYYWKSVDSSYEVDFVIRKEEKTIALVQVSFDIENQDTLKRELRALITASKELNCDKLILITRSEDRKVEDEWFGTKATITMMPLWKWLISGIDEI
ncbi:MAG: ATP-binding protein [Bacteroidota bacterium]|nr:ATP-binding protein [Bacteroidota bacterium]